jgi:hypothetical protein
MHLNKKSDGVIVSVLLPLTAAKRRTPITSRPMASKLELFRRRAPVAVGLAVLLTVEHMKPPSLSQVVHIQPSSNADAATFSHGAAAADPTS